MYIVRGRYEMVRGCLGAPSIAFHHLSAILGKFRLAEQVVCSTNLSTIHVNVFPCCFGDEGQFIWANSNNFAVFVVEPLYYRVLFASKRVVLNVYLGSASQLWSGKFTEGVKEGIVKQTKRKMENNLLDSEAYGCQLEDSPEQRRRGSHWPHWPFSGFRQPTWRAEFQSTLATCQICLNLKQSGCLARGDIHAPRWLQR
jgi:hypothetical protein